MVSKAADALRDGEGFLVTVQVITLLTAAGLAPAYASRPLAEADMAPARAAVEWLLTRHDPFPAFAVDRQWHVQKMNNSANTILAGLGLGPGDSLPFPKRGRAIVGGLGGKQVKVRVDGPTAH